MNPANNAENIAGVGGAKRKNGHKATCACHICENIINKAKRGDYKPKVASGKVNGHKAECRCPICKNMMAKQGGSHTKKHRVAISGRKSNGHRENCQCPICKNMRSAKMSRRNKSRTNKRR